LREFFSQDAEEKKEEAQTVKGDYPLKKKKSQKPPFYPTSLHADGRLLLTP
jgi:hypothetical protein